MAGIDVQAAIDRFNDAAIARPGLVVVVFLVLTVVFVPGIPLVETGDEGTNAFAEDVPAFQAQEDINENFGTPFGADDQSTQLIHVSENALSRTELVRNIRVLERAKERTDLRVESATGPAVLVASTIDPTARTLTEQRRVLEGSSDREVRQAVRQLSEDPRFVGSLSEDFNPTTPTAKASITVISHDFPADSDALQDAQVQIREIGNAQTGDIRAFGNGILNEEFGSVIGDSLAIVVPVVLVLILLFLIVAYRDPVDLVLGLVALLMTIIWTFGFVGYADIPFDQQQIAVPVLLLAVGIDFGIHIVNRYREELEDGLDRLPAMRAANRQLVVAFFIVTVTTVFGFGANIVSEIGPTRRFGIVTAVGIVFTFLIFGVFLPSAKLVIDRARDRIRLPEFGSKPIASEDSALGRLLAVGVTITQYAPLLFVIGFLLVGTAAAGYAQGVDRTFDSDDFLPPEELPTYIQNLPEPFAPGEYTVTRDINFLQNNFEAAGNQQAVIYVEGPFEDGHSLRSLQRVNRDPPETFVASDREANPEGPVSVIQAHAQRNPEFATLVERNDGNSDGIPDRNLDEIYDRLFASSASGQAAQVITDDRRGVKLTYDIKEDANQAEAAADARQFATEFRQKATATGETVVFDAVGTVIFQTAILSLVLAIGTVAIFLVFVYGVLERRPLLGVMNLFPILVTVALLVATMRALGIPLNALTATLLSITIGVGIAYSVHVTHRFIDEYRDHSDAFTSLQTTLTGTGGALTGSMLTTSLGTGALVLSITPVLGTFGLLMAVSVFYSYLTAIVVLPPALLVWSEYLDGRFEPIDVPGIQTYTAEE